MKPKYILLILVVLLSYDIATAQISMQQPFDLGSKAQTFSFTDTKNTALYQNNFQGQSTNDVFYKFTLSQAMEISISHCGSELYDTYLHVLNSEGNQIYENDDNYDFCSNPYNSYIHIASLQPGVYYVVSEGYGDDGNITTTIEGIKPLPATGLYDGSAVMSAVNAGTNYILSITPTVATSDVSGLGVNESMQTVQYFDGLGRPMETVQRGITPTGKDLVTLTEYDGVGREYRQWLPVTSTGSGAYVAPATITGNSTTLYGGDAKPYATTNFESSPLNRVTGKYGAGASWYAGKKNDSILYQTNAANEVAYYFVNSSNKLERNSYYDANTLYKTAMADEDGKTTTEYKDKLGRVVMKRNSTNVNTYFVYNDLGQLSYVLPPIAADSLPGSGQISDDHGVMKRYTYLYKYDERGNNVVKRLPGCDSILMVYDKADRLVLSQDGSQREKKQWTVTKYDVFGRVLYTGYLTRDQTRKDLKAILDPLLITESYDGTATFANTGYTCGYFVAEITPLLVNYYDSYKFRRLLSATDSTNLKYATIAGYDAQFGEDKVKGLLTGTRTYILNQKTTSFLEKVSYLTNALYYDAYGRVVQTRGINHFGSYEYTYNRYDFVGRLLMNKKYHGGLSINEITRNEYDNAGRLTKVRYKIDYKDTVTLAQYSYDELGRPIQKLRHNGTDTEQFAYNIRNWPTQIKSGTSFEENLYYTTNPLGTSPCYNGNISYSTWTYNSIKKGYAYMYDNLNRLSSADYTLNDVMNENGDLSEYFSYDKQGNITFLTRTKANDFGDYGNTLDGLIYYYNGNQLRSISDDYSSQNQYSLKEYNGDASNGTKFKYDANGNMIKDLDRKIVTIRYNILNLPDTVQFANGNQIVNRYSASGEKIRTEYFTRVTALAAPLTEGKTIQQSYTYGVVDQTGSAYVDNVEYKTTNGSSLGRCRVYNSEGFANVYGYLNYYRKDHLGNNREVWQAGYTGVTAGTVQRTQFYPSGLPWAEGTGASVQSRKFIGKEFVEMHGYNCTDLGARVFCNDAVVIPTPDPLSEKYYSTSPYSYCGGNPINAIDPDGMDIYWLTKDGRMMLARKTEDKSDVIYSATKDGNGVVKSQEVNDKQLLPQLRSGGIAETTNKTDAFNVFKFSADNSKVEWKLKGYNTESNMGFLLNTSRSTESVSDKNGSYDPANLVFDLHSHPPGTDNRGPSGYITKLGNDYNSDNFNADCSTLLTHLNNNATSRHYIYHKGTQQLIFYDQNTAASTPQKNKTQNEQGVPLGAVKSATLMRTMIFHQSNH